MFTKDSYDIMLDNVPMNLKFVQNVKRKKMLLFLLTKTLKSQKIWMVPAVEEIGEEPKKVLMTSILILIEMTEINNPVDSWNYTNSQLNTMEVWPAFDFFNLIKDTLKT